MRVLVTGTAGFIGFHLAQRFLARGDEVVGLDVVNDYYDVSLKRARLERLTRQDRFSFEKVALEDRDGVSAAFSTYRPEIVVNLAAQAGVRYSLSNPHAYVDSITYDGTIVHGRLLQCILRRGPAYVCIYMGGENEGE